MNKTIICEELTGLFIIRKCENLVVEKCDECEKKICDTHKFNAKELKTFLEHTWGDITTLCLTCFAKFDPRLTKEHELYSKDRAVWRKKMMERFHTEYPYMLFMAEDYGSLFDTSSGVYVGDYSDDDSYFDS